MSILRKIFGLHDHEWVEKSRKMIPRPKLAPGPIETSGHRSTELLFDFLKITDKTAIILECKLCKDLKSLIIEGDHTV